ncbi:MAG: glycoside hydrolase family 130 protein [Sedimentisphaerales bacterium]|nr:glycoside hydrolase family 130 protein [Sedimentisphaerales bacterium]
MIHRYEKNPVLAAKDIPYPATLIFNAGVTKYAGRYVMVFRNDWGDWKGGGGPAGTNLGVAYSEDGMTWKAENAPCWELETDEIRRVYDPRLTVIDGSLYLCVAVDTNHGIRGGVVKTEDLKHFEILSMTAPDNRNMVLFPEKHDGKIMRLERPFPVYSRPGNEDFDIWFSDSPDGCYWGNTRLVLGAEQVPWCNNKIGPAAPPIKTKAGWLALIHVVDTEPGRVFEGWEKNFVWTKRYTMGLMLLDTDEPWRVIGMSKKPVMIPETEYELTGFRGSVIFPGGMILEDNGEVKIYYGAADTVECLATADVDELIDLCLT